MKLLLISTYVQNLMVDLQNGKETKSELLGVLQDINTSIHCFYSASKNKKISNTMNETCLRNQMGVPFSVDFVFSNGIFGIDTDGETTTLINFKLKREFKEKYSKWYTHGFTEVNALKIQENYLDIIENEDSLVRFIDNNTNLIELMNQVVPKFMEYK